MAYQMVKLEKKDLVGTLTLNRPEKLNAFNRQILEEFEAAVDEAGRDPEVKVLVIRGGGRAFSTGYDLTRGAEESVEDDRRRLQKNLERWLKLWDLPKPVIAMVHGYCLAGATQLCICADMIFVADDAAIGFPNIPAGGGYIGQMWSWLVGPGRAKYMSFLPGSQMSGKESEAFGWATRSFPADKLEQETYNYARRVAKVPADVLYIKKLSINRTLDLQGFRTAILSGAEWDAIAHSTGGVHEIRKMINERGLRGAIEWFREQ